LLSGGKKDVDARVKRGQDENTGPEAFGDQLPSHDDRDQQTSGTVPVVFVLVSDPVAQGFADSLTKSGSNLTGFSRYEFSIGGKWLGLLKEISCGLARVAVLFNPETSPQSKFFVPAIESAASSLGVQAPAVPARATGDIEPALESFARQPNGGLILHPSAGKAHRRFGASPSPADDQHG